MEAFIVAWSWARVLRAWRFGAGMVDGRSGPLNTLWDRQGEWHFLAFSPPLLLEVFLTKTGNVVAILKALF